MRLGGYVLLSCLRCDALRCAVCERMLGLGMVRGRAEVCDAVGCDVTCAVLSEESGYARKGICL